MAQIQFPKPTATYGEKSSQVESITGAELVAVRYTDPTGKHSMCIAICFGKDAEDDDLGVFILMDETAMKTGIDMAPNFIRKKVRSYLARKVEDAAEDIPDSDTVLPAALVGGTNG